MRVLQLTKHYPPHSGGIESVTFDLTEGLNTKGIHCDVLCANDSRFYQRDELNGYVVERTSMIKKIQSTSISPQLIYRLRKLKDRYDIIHVHFPDPLAALALFITRPKAKILIHWHSDIVKQKKALRFFLPLQNWVLRRANIIVGTSPTYITFSTQLQEFINKTVAIPIGINNRLDVSEKDAADIKTRYKNKKIVFSLGRLVYYKGFEYLIQAAEFLSDDYVILIGGKGPLENKLRFLIKEKRLEERVILLGHIPQEELGNYFQTCDIFCFPSVLKSEAFGVVLLEAMLFGKPIVATTIHGSGVSWVNKDNYSGYNVSVKDGAAIASAIKKILTDDCLYKKMSEQAKMRYKEFFTVDKMVDNFADLYSKLES